jgi:polyphosphate kinase 2 (PPK2 family)
MRSPMNCLIGMFKQYYDKYIKHLSGIKNFVINTIWNNSRYNTVFVHDMFNMITDNQKKKSSKNDCIPLIWC